MLCETTSSALLKSCSIISKKSANLFPLDKLYKFSKRYEKLNSQEQIVFLKEAEKVFDAFDKVPEILWEEEYQKYMEVLDKYKDVKMVRWAQN